MRYQLFNLDRHHSIAHIPESVEFDRGIIYDMESPEPPILGIPQYKVVFAGFMPECSEWLKRNSV